MDTPGIENLCLYFACLQAMGKRATLQDARDLKAKVHARIGKMISDPTNRGRGDLKRAYTLTNPATDHLATDEVLPALATELGRKIVVHEGSVPIEVDGWSVLTRELHINYTPGHYYASVNNFAPYV